MYNYALEINIEGLVDSPAKRIKGLRVNNGREIFLNKGQVKRLLEAAEKSRQNNLRSILLVLLLTGMRKSEVLNLRWAHIDFERRILTIPENKTGKVRYVPTSDALIVVLSKVSKLNDCPFVFPNPKTKKPFLSINNSLIKVRKEAGLSSLTLHDLRHTFASTLFNEGGFLLHEAQKILGHKDIRMTQRYSHLGQPALKRAVDLAAKKWGYHN